MKAGVASPNGVVIQDVPQPKPKPTDILVKVKAIALNRADLGSAKGDTSHGAAAGTPIGSEFSGEVVEVGAQVRDFKAGDRVMCHSPGSHAEYAVSDYGRAMKVPDGMSFEQAATLPIGLNTLHNALVTAGRMNAGDNVMVQGASSGVMRPPMARARAPWIGWIGLRHPLKFPACASWRASDGGYTPRVSARDHNPHGRRLHLPIVDVTGDSTDGAKPPWLKVRLATGPNVAELRGIMRGLSLHTVCEEASCPNLGECWEEREATFLILGDTCTRRCGFCDVRTGRPGAVDEGEPARIAEAVRAMGLRFVVLTGVARDDLAEDRKSTRLNSSHT
mgnify:CR=1 FL=1